MTAVRRYEASMYDSNRWDGFELRPGDIIISTPPKCGTTWTQMNSGLPNQSARRVQALAIDPRLSPPVVYAGTQGEGVFKSIDGGANWLRVALE